MPYDPNLISNTNNANSFLYAAERCFEQRPMSDNTIQALLIPAVVCTTFAIELTLKAVTTIEGKDSKGHNLYDLYEKLSGDSQSALQKSLSLTDADLRKEITKVANAFVDWRYIYESQTEVYLDIDFIRKLATAAKDLVE